MDSFFSSISTYFTTAALAVVTFLAALIPSTTSSEVVCIIDQEVRVEELAQAYESGEAEKVDEQSFCSFDLEDADEYIFSDLQLIASHNSYKLYQPTIGYYISSTFFPLFDYDADVMNYEHDNTTDQLNMGIRSLEWDVVEYDGYFDGYLIQHESYVDPLSSIPNLELAFEEVLMWSEYNEDHIPIVIIIECKDMAIPSADKTTISTAEHVVELSELISEILGDKLYTPTEMVGDYDSMTDMRLDNGYPSLDELLGKIIVIIHPGTACTDYGESVAFEDQLLFIGDQEDENACFSIISAWSPTNVAIQNNYIVRSFVSNWGDYSYDDESKYISAGSNIISSDYINEDKSEDLTRFANGYTITVRDIG